MLFENMFLKINILLLTNLLKLRFSGKAIFIKLD